MGAATVTEKSPWERWRPAVQLTSFCSSSEWPATCPERLYDRTMAIERTGQSRQRESAHLLRSPGNAKRLRLALDQARRGEGLEMSVEELRREVLGGEGDR